MSISTTSGCSRRVAATASTPVAGVAHDLKVGLGVEDHPEPGSDQFLVVGQQDADGYGCSAEIGRRAWTP
jgi:hypothetical protein